MAVVVVVPLICYEHPQMTFENQKKHNCRQDDDVCVPEKKKFSVDDCDILF